MEKMELMPMLKIYLTIHWGLCLQCDGFHKSKVKLVLKSF